MVCVFEVVFGPKMTSTFFRFFGWPDDLSIVFEPSSGGLSIDEVWGGRFRVPGSGVGGRFRVPGEVAFAYLLGGSLSRTGGYVYETT